MYNLRKPIYNSKNGITTLFDLGKPKIKFINISTEGSLDTGKKVHKPWGKTLDLTCLHVMHLP